MTEPETLNDLRAGLIEGLRAARAAERNVFAAVDPGALEAPAPDGGWSPKDVLAHLGAWRQHQVERLAAIREGRGEPAPAAQETDEINATIHAERADWPWDRVLSDAEDSSTALIAEVEAATTPTLAVDRTTGSIMGNGPEHSLAHLAPIAARTGVTARVFQLASEIEAIVDRGGWPSRSAAYARYNLACFYSLSGRLDEARTLLRQSLPEQEELRTYAPVDDDLVALRDEIPSLIGG